MSTLTVGFRVDYGARQTVMIEKQAVGVRVKKKHPVTQVIPVGIVGLCPKGTIGLSLGF